MTKFFGTDGVRSLANHGKLAPLAVLRLAQIAGRYFTSRCSSRGIAVIGKDTRESGDMIEAALVAGLTSVGIHVELLGIIPSSGVALMTKTLRADFGMMITASHNGFQDNGIKFFNAEGHKLSDADEEELEALLKDDAPALASSVELGRTFPRTDVQSRYIEICKSSLPRGFGLGGLKIVVDAANGAAFFTAAETFRELGAHEVISIGAMPTGKNINAGCGSTAPDLLAEHVITNKADLGIALDGDADRLIMCDETGRIIDGDQLLGLIGVSWKLQNRLSKPGVVATVMSNLGLERHLEREGLALIRTPVGDRHVAARMRKDGYNLGGEQSGHLLMTEYSPTGDGTIAALQILAEIRRQDRKASEVLSVFETVPQVLKNINFTGQSPMGHSKLLAAIKSAESELGASGRVLIRASGTEPLIRVMAEGDDLLVVESVTDALIETIRTIVS